MILCSNGAVLLVGWDGETVKSNPEKAECSINSPERTRDVFLFLKDMGGLGRGV